MPFIEERKLSDVPLFKGYFNYYILEGKSTLKTHNFANLTKKEVKTLALQFGNAKKYDFKGSMIVRQKLPALGYTREKITTL